MTLELPELRPEEQTPLVEALLGIIRQLADRVAELEETNRQLRDEIAVLKGQTPRPKMSPSILHTPPQTNAGTTAGPRRGKPSRPKTAELTIHHTLLLHPPDLPMGATFKGYEVYVVQDLLIRNENTKYLRAR